MMADITCLQLDVGNSSVKWRLVNSDGECRRGQYLADDPVSREAFLGCTDAVDAIWISSVASADAEATLQALLHERWGISPWFARTEAKTGDLVNSYTDPARMGVDRWLAMLGARARSEARICVVDVGSALTIDLVSADGRHEGGYIIPGSDLMERSLLSDTGRVRFDEAADYALVPGRSTAEAVRHGIAVAQVGAVALVLEQALEQVGVAPALFFCGGGAQAVMTGLGGAGELCPDLVFEGLAVMAGLRD